jgi:hypothetical protein
VNNYNVPKTVVRRVLTGSRIDNCKMLYCMIADIFDEEQTDEVNKSLLIHEVMRRSKGSLNPDFVKEEIDKI